MAGINMARHLPQLLSYWLYSIQPQQPIVLLIYYHIVITWLVLTITYLANVYTNKVPGLIKGSTSKEMVARTDYSTQLSHLI